MTNCDCCGKLMSDEKKENYNVFAVRHNQRKGPVFTSHKTLYFCSEECIIKHYKG